MESEEKNPEEQNEDPVPLTDEEFAKFQKKEKRTQGIISMIVDLITGFFH